MANLKAQFYSVLSCIFCGCLNERVGTGICARCIMMRAVRVSYRPLTTPIAFCLLARLRVGCELRRFCAKIEIRDGLRSSQAEVYGEEAMSSSQDVS